MPPKAAAKGGEAGVAPEKKKNYGQVPKYLQKMNKAKEENLRQRAASRENAKAPPGTRRMGDDEKATMVTELRAT